MISLGVDLKTRGLWERDCQLDSVIHPLNNWGQPSKSRPKPVLANHIRDLVRPRAGESRHIIKENVKSLFPLHLRYFLISHC